MHESVSTADEKTGSINKDVVQYLAVLMDDQENVNASSYSVQCNMSLNSTLEFQGIYNATYRMDSQAQAQVAINSTGKACNPDPTVGVGATPSLRYPLASIPQVLTNTARVTAGSLLALSFNSSLSDVFKGSVVYYSDYLARSPRLAFQNSRNGVEDTIGSS